MDVFIDASEARIFAVTVRAEGDQLDARIASTTQHFGQLLLTQVQANASGRPGPRVVTGAYRRSWVLDVETTAEGSSATAGTNSPQARRLNLGFVGVDSLGRHYNESPLPHADPALDRIGPQYADALSALVA